MSTDLFYAHGLLFVVFLGPFIAFDLWALWFLIQAIRGKL